MSDRSGGDGPGVHLSGDGRMGTALRRLVVTGDASAGTLGIAELADADVVIDYSHPDWTGPLVAKLLAAPRPLVVGTTGLGPTVEADLAALAERVPVVIAANTGTGINVLRRIVEQAVAALPDWDIEVLEMHHRRKVDAPSGTAWMLVEAAAEVREPGSRRNHAVPSRVGETGARTDAEIGVQTLRGGDVVGEHTVYLVGPGERIELTHRCWDRDTFARGGLRAARWALTAAPVMYTMAYVLGL
jgi:4-hydroxy-tetrahydrodipicolinate reductase